MTKLRLIGKLPIVRRSPKDFYEDIYKFGKSGKNKQPEFTYFPLCRQSQKDIYIKYANILENSMKRIKKSINTDIISLCKLGPMDSVVIAYMIDIISNASYHVTTPREIYDIIDSFEQNSESYKLGEFMKESNNIKGNIENAMCNITSGNNDITWNIEHLIKYNGKTEDFRINMRTPFIGYDDDTVYHIMMLTEYSELNHWDTMINILMERFLISNPNKSKKNYKDNYTRYYGKKIKTYLFVLKTNNYIKFEWEWKDETKHELKELCIDAMFKHFSSKHECIFNYYYKIKGDREIWGGFETPMIFMYSSEKLEYLEYVKDYFKYLESKYRESTESREQYKILTNDKCKFVSELDSRLNLSLRSFFGQFNEEMPGNYEF